MVGRSTFAVVAAVPMIAFTAPSAAAAVAPPSASTTFMALSGVSADSTTDAWAVGFTGGGSANAPLALDKGRLQPAAKRRAVLRDGRQFAHRCLGGRVHRP
jgi:hypothetical protein